MVHVVDIGGLGMGTDGRQFYEAGLSIPLWLWRTKVIRTVTEPKIQIIGRGTARGSRRAQARSAEAVVPIPEGPQLA
jgi:hypothetical protein